VIAQDKVLHFVISTLGVVAMGAILPLWLAAMVMLTVGLLKEVAWDRWLARGDPDTWDFVADVLGVALGVVFWVFVRGV
jgi:hypothetical protein